MAKRKKQIIHVPINGISEETIDTSADVIVVVDPPVQEIKVTPDWVVEPMTARELMQKFQNEPWEHLLYAVLAACIKKCNLTEEEIRVQLARVKEVYAERFGLVT